MEPQYRSTFYARDPVRKMARRLWERKPDDAVGDALRAHWLVSHVPDAELYYADLVRGWVERRHRTWERQRPAWFTPEWRDALAQVIEDGHDQSARARCTCVSQQSHSYKVADC